MSQSLLTISMITKESLRSLKNEINFTKSIDRQYSDEFAESGAKIGSTINVRKPVRFTVTDGPSLVLQDINEDYVPLTLSKQKHIGFQFSSKDLKLSIDEFGQRYINPAVISLANQVDLDGLALATQVAQSVGVPGTSPATFLLAAQAKQKLDESSTPVDSNRTIILNPNAETTMVDALKGLFQSSEQIAQQYEKGVMGIAAGFKWKMDQNVGSYTTGPQGGTPQVDGTGTVTGASITTKGWTSAAASRLVVGDVFTIAGVYSVNHQSYQSTGALKQFTVTAAFSSDSSGKGAVSISPAIVTSGPTQNVSAAPVDAAGITVVDAAGNPGGTICRLNLAFHKDAFTLGMADLDLPGGVDMAARERDKDAGIAIRMVRAYDINNDRYPARLDIIYGLAMLRQDLATRFCG